MLRRGLSKIAKISHCSFYQKRKPAYPTLAGYIIFLAKPQTYLNTGELRG